MYFILFIFICLGQYIDLLPIQPPFVRPNWLNPDISPIQFAFALHYQSLALFLSHCGPKSDGCSRWRDRSECSGSIFCQKGPLIVTMPCAKNGEGISVRCVRTNRTPCEEWWFGFLRDLQQWSDYVSVRSSEPGRNWLARRIEVGDNLEKAFIVFDTTIRLFSIAAPTGSPE